MRTNNSKQMWIAGAAVGGLGVAALAAAGGLDSTFGTGGVVQYAASGNWLAGCAVQPDGRVIVASPDGTGASQQWRIDRRLGNGSVDTSWGSGGSVTMLTGADVRDVAIDASGRVLAAGRSVVTVAGKGGKTTSTNSATVVRWNFL